MPPDTVVVTAAPEAAPVAAPAPSDVAETLDAAAAVVGMAAALSEQAKPDSRTEEIIALISEARDDIRSARGVLDEILSVSREILALQVVDVLADEMEAAPETAPAEAAPAAVVEIAAEGGEITKETVVETVPPVAETRKEKSGRTWL